MPVEVVINVRVGIDTSPAERREVLEGRFLPDIERLPGFELFSFLNDGRGNGYFVFDFDTEEHARAALGPLTKSGGSEILSAGVFEIEFAAGQ